MKRTLRSVIIGILTSVLCMGLFAAESALAADGPNKSDKTCAYILAQNDEVAGLEFDGIAEEYKERYNDPFDFEGLDYDEKTNTLTVTNFTANLLDTNEMGDDFKIRLVGDSKLEMLRIWGYGYGGSVTFIGDGTLTVDRFWMRAEGSDTALTVKDSAKISVICPIDDHGLDYPTFMLDQTNIGKDAIKAAYFSDMVEQTLDIVEAEYATIDEIYAKWSLVYKDGEAFYVSGCYDVDLNTGEWFLTDIEVISKDGEVPATFSSEAEMEAAGYKYKVIGHQYTYKCIEPSITFTAPGTKLEAPKKGDILTINGEEYKVTTAGTASKAGAVAFNAPDKNQSTVVIPDSIKVDGITYNVTSVSANAFSGNKTVTSITIGKNVKTINKKAFYNCSKLKTLKITTTKLTKDTVKADAFKKISTSCKITVPSGKASAYKKVLQGAGLSTKVSVK